MGGPTLRLLSADPGEQTQGYVNGQIYTTRYGIAVASTSAQAPLDLIVIHARGAKEYANPPS